MFRTINDLENVLFSPTGVEGSLTVLC